MRNPNLMAAWFSGVLVCALASHGLAQDWPQWMGPNRDAKASFKAPAAWPESLAQKWKVPIGEGVATPALVGNKLYVFARQNGKETLWCLDATSGKEIWKDQYEAKGVSGPASGFSGPRSSPAVGEGKVVTIGVHGMLSCLDAATGKVLWRKDDFGDSIPRFATSSSPIIVDGMCVAQLGGRDNGALVAYDLASGEQKWKWTGESPAYASPVLMTVDDMKLIIAETEQRIVAIRLADGKQVWETPFAVEGMRAYNASTPVVEGQVLIFSGGGRGTRAVRLRKEGEGIAGEELWRNADQSVQFNTPVVKDGLVYGLSQSNELFCIDKQTGKVVWTGAIAPASEGGPAGGGSARGGPGGRDGGGQSSRPADGAGPRGGGQGERQGDGREGADRRGGGGRGEREGGGRSFSGRGGGGGRGGYGSIVDAGSVLLALTPASQLIVFAPGDKQYTEQAKIKVADTPTYAYPVISGNRVFIKDQDSVTLWTIQ